MTPSSSRPMAPAPRLTNTARSPLPAIRAMSGARWLPAPLQTKPAQASAAYTIAPEPGAFILWSWEGALPARTGEVEG